MAAKSKKKTGRKQTKKKKTEQSFFRGGNLCLGYSGSQYFAIDQ